MVLMVTMPLFAERVTPETARKVAATFLNNNGAKSALLTDLTKEAGFTNLYIFNAEQGFVVMAADDCVKPILGYSLTGRFVAENMPTNVSGWLQGYNDEIQYAIDNQIRATSETTRMWKELVEGNAKAGKATVVVAPLIQTKWNQNKYYNRLCPAASGGPDGHAYVGCVATAMAQIMKYYEYPTKGIGSHSYTWNNQTLSADFGATTYDWANMLATYEYYYDDNGTSHWIYGDPTEEQIAAVATLSYHCGVAVDMSYGGGSSGAPVAFVGDALKSFFNYSPSISYKQKSFNSNVYYTDDEWITMVKAELDARRPLEYGGQDPNGNSGHAFVCDGYNNDDYFHFNWGWAGHYNGYFSIDNLNTGANSGESGAGNGVYTRDQEAVFGIQPVRCTASDPTSLTYTLTGLQGLTLNWTAADGAASYNIYRNGNYVGNSTTNSYSETAPFGDNEYYVRSVDTNGNLSLSSNYVNVYIGYQTPIVNDLEASLTGNNVQLSWTAPEWCYPETESAVLNYGQENPYYSWTSVYYAHRHLAANLAQYAGKAVYKVSTYIKYPGTYSLYIYTKSNQSNRPDPNSLAYSITGVNVTLTNGWFEFNTEGPIILTGTDDLWVVIKQENTGQTYAVPSFDLTEHNINAFYAGSSPTALYDCNPDYNCAWLINTYLTDGTYTYNLYQDGTSIAQNLSQTSYNATLHNNAANVFTVRTNYSGSETEDSNKVGFTKGIASLGSLEMSSNDKMTVTEGTEPILLNGSFSSETPVSVKKNEPLLRAAIDIPPAEYREYGENGEDIEVYFEVKDLVVSTASGNVVMFKDGKRQEPTTPSTAPTTAPVTEPSTAPVSDPVTDPVTEPSTAPADEYSLDLATNLDDAVMTVTSKAGEPLSLSYTAPEDWNIINFQFALYNNTTGTITNQSAFTPQMMFNQQDEKLFGSVSSLDGFQVNKDESLLSFDFNCDATGSIGDLYLCIEDMTVLNDKGEEVLVFANGVRVDKPRGIIGDVNRDGVVAIDDVTMLQKFLADFTKADGSPILDEKNADDMYVADVDRDGAITVTDVTLIQRYLAEYITSFEAAQ